MTKPKSSTASQTKVSKSRSPKKAPPSKGKKGVVQSNPSEAWPMSSHPITKIKESKQKKELRFVGGPSGLSESTVCISKTDTVKFSTQLNQASDFTDSVSLEHEIGSIKKVKFSKLPLMGHFLSEGKKGQVHLYVKVGVSSAIQYEPTVKAGGGFRKVTLRKSLNTVPVNARITASPSDLIDTKPKSYVDVAG